MYVKVINHGLETIYDCERVKVKPDDVNSGQVVLTVDPSGHEINTVLQKKHSRVYVMNDEGHTIDVYRWCDGA